MPRYARCTCSSSRRSRPAPGEHDAAVLEHVAAPGQGQRLARCSARPAGRGARAVDLADDRGRSPARSWAPARARARRASAGAGAPSARGRWPASAAGRPTWCRRPARAARPGCGKSPSTRSRLSRRCGTGRAGVGAQLEVLEHGQAREDLAALRHLHDAALHHRVRGQPVEPHAVEQDLPRPRTQETGDRAQHRRLARAVGAHHREDLPRPRSTRSTAVSAGRSP